MAVSKFAAAMKAKANNWKKAAKAKPRTGGKFGPADVPDGQYEAVISAKCGVGEKGKLTGKAFVEITATIRGGEHEGKEPRAFYVLEGKPISDDPDAMPTSEQQLVGDLKQILPDIDVETAIMEDVANVESLVQEINDRGLVMKIGVRNRTNKTDATKKYQDVFFNEVLESSGGSDGHEESEEGEPEEGSQEEGEEGGEEESQEEGGEPDTDDEPVAPAVGDEFLWQPKGGKKRKFTVKTVNQRKETVSVSDGTKKFSDVPWSALEPV